MYDTATALRQAIEARLNQHAREDGVEINRLRRGFVFERIMARLELSEPGAWVVKGGIALEWRLGKRARGTRDLDLVPARPCRPWGRASGPAGRSPGPGPGRGSIPVRGRAGSAARCRLPLQREDESAGKEFATVRLDVAARGVELVATERLHPPGAIPALEPLIRRRIESLISPGVKVLSQDDLIAPRLADYLRRHPEMESRLARGGGCSFLTTDASTHFDHLAEIFMGHPISSETVELAPCRS